ncbi:hypothetical protein WN51_14549 [Melipona quadrifasciata]|uniref:Reverse transcriptase domain-containing protein n=1 Tax=Melipona quadrifasciata TaxID=166423 RepID=A0A0M9A195_9HYME|nr:hypothetical protein WN51_14549 [Melipona quadrifasciata]
MKRKLSDEKLKTAKEKIDSFLEQRIIIKQPWANPIHLVKKKTGDWKTCGDFKKLYAQILNRYPPRFITELFEKMHGKIIFSKLNLTKSYHQMNSNDTKKNSNYRMFWSRT